MRGTEGLLPIKIRLCLDQIGRQVYIHLIIVGGVHVHRVIVTVIYQMYCTCPVLNDDDSLTEF